jgi:hypothetical protein
MSETKLGPGTLYLDPTKASVDETEFGEWQPIETAPRDGTFIIAWQPHISDSDIRILRSVNGYWSDEHGIGQSTLRDPKYWMPLPEPPK